MIAMATTTISLDSSDATRWASAADATALHRSVWQLQTVATADPMVITLQLLVAGPTPQSKDRTRRVEKYLIIAMDFLEGLEHSSEVPPTGNPEGLAQKCRSTYMLIFFKFGQY